MGSAGDVQEARRERGRARTPGRPRTVKGRLLNGVRLPPALLCSGLRPGHCDILPQRQVTWAPCEISLITGWYPQRARACDRTYLVQFQLIEIKLGHPATPSGSSKALWGQCDAHCVWGRETRLKCTVVTEKFIECGRRTLNTRTSGLPGGGEVARGSVGHSRAPDRTRASWSSRWRSSRR